MSFKEIMFRLCLLAQAEILYIVPPENCEVAQYNLCLLYTSDAADE